MAEVTKNPEGLANESAERWLDLDDQLKEKITENIAENGASSFEAANDVLVLADQRGARSNQVVVSFEYAVSKMSAENQMATGNGDVVVGIATVGTENGNLGIIISRLKGISKDKYATERKRMLDKANMLLETFEKPKLPIFTSQGRSTLS